MEDIIGTRKVSPTPAYITSLGNESLEHWLQDHRVQIEEQLSGQGAILIRGLDIDTPESLDYFVSLFPLKNFTYNESLSNALRVNKTPRVFTANEAPPHIDIELHHEMAQTPLSPDWLFFSCRVQPTRGGSTPLCRSDLVYQDLLQQQPTFLAQCEDQGLYYRQKFALNPDEASAQGRSWPHLLQLIDENQAITINEPSALQQLKSAAESQLHAKGYKYQWHKDTLEIISPVLPAVRRAKNNQKVFFNQLLAAYTSWGNALNLGPECVFLGDGQPIAQEYVHRLQAICQKHTKDLCWQAGDVAILDNTMVMHGRRAFQGKRQVYASLALDPVA